MLEIFLIVYLSKKIGKIVEEKEHKKGIYIFMLVIFWLLGEFIGAFIGMIVTGKEGIIIYLYALIGAGFGALLSFLIVKNLSKKEVPEDSDIT
ncbi:MAG: hypothetical protein DRJ05_09465 [Bacteroidetes bacterium]|nr:MAG: hypothetical protein DRJ05_09465 [Bacteroidota bacterium]